MTTAPQKLLLKALQAGQAGNRAEATTAIRQLLAALEQDPAPDQSVYDYLRTAFNGRQWLLVEVGQTELNHMVSALRERQAELEARAGALRSQIERERQKADRLRLAHDIRATLTQLGNSETLVLETQARRAEVDRLSSECARRQSDLRQALATLAQLGSGAHNG